MRLILLATAVSAAFCADDLETLATESIRKNCLQCHSAQAKMGGLVLDSREAAMKGGSSGPALVPGDEARSLLVDRVRTGKMPAGNPLPEAERDVFARWVRAGAPWKTTLAAAERKRAGKDWWSLRPLRKPAAGETIDRWIAAARKEKGLAGSAEADRRTLIRRATFDLTGLPPTPEELAAFLNDARPGSYEKLIDRLLASNAYGERWGRHWMDVIRFGESHGYEQNHLRPNAWPFRDYIIRSFNEDRPFDRVIQEHLAGDQLGAGDPKVEVATGFLVAGPHDTVGNQNEAARRQQRADDLDDMVNATASAFLGLTVNCARCHDHKFDPILQSDYYKLAAVFAGVTHAERELAPGGEIQRHRAMVEPLENELKSAAESLKKIREEAAPRIAAQKDAILAKHRPAPNGQLTEEAFAPAPARFVRLRIQATSTGGATALEELEVWSGTENLALAAKGGKVQASSVRKADDLAAAYSEQHLIDGKFDQRWIAADNKPCDLTIELPKAAAVSRVSWSRDRAGGFQGRFDGPIPSEYVVEVSADGKAWREVASSKGRLPVTEAQQDTLLLMAVLTPAEKQHYQELDARRKQLQQKLAETPKLPAGYIGRFEQPKEPVYLLKRGNVMDRGAAMPGASPSTLSDALEGFEADGPEAERRLKLARWMTDARNPLTPRVLANRIWQHHFGRGIVGTPSDYGFNGERPTHPELLDYLASRLQQGGWRLKALHKEIMMSAAYRQSSAYDEAQARIDSESRYVWRFPPQRLEAEAIRDTILAVSGALNRAMGGPGFRLYRYTVDNVATYYPLETFGPETYRRSVYHQAARSVRAELLGQHDCPDSALPEPRRVVTTSPLQALSLMNNSFLLDQAKLFSERLKKEAGATPAAQVDRAFLLAFGRQPTAEERSAAVQLIGKRGLFAFCRALLNANEFVYMM